MSTTELYSINSDSSTSVFGYFVCTTASSISDWDRLIFPFDSAFTPSFKSVKLNNFSSSITGVVPTVSIEGNRRYLINMQNIQANKTYTIYIQTLFV